MEVVKSLDLEAEEAGRKRPVVVAMTLSSVEAVAERQQQEVEVGGSQEGPLRSPPWAEEAAEEGGGPRRLEAEGIWTPAGAFWGVV